MLANVLFPNWLITLLLLGLLMFLTYKTARKAWSLHRSEARYLAQRAEERPRPAVSEKRVAAADSSAMKMEKTGKKASSQGPTLDRGSPASARSVAGQEGAHVERRDQEAGIEIHMTSARVDQPGPSRQCASLEVEGLPKEVPSGKQFKPYEHGLLCGVVAAMSPGKRVRCMYLWLYMVCICSPLQSQD